MKIVDGLLCLLLIKKCPFTSAVEKQVVESTIEQESNSEMEEVQKIEEETNDKEDSIKTEETEVPDISEGSSNVSDISKDSRCEKLLEEIKYWQPLDEYDKHILSAVGSYHNPSNSKFYILICYFNNIL